MNVLIFGQMATGKSTLALALKKFYEGRDGYCEVIEDEPVNTRIEMQAKRSIALKRMKSTKSSNNFHTVVVMLMPPDPQMVDTPNWDYVIKCEAM